MGKYSSRERGPIKKIDKTPHAVWRGIGCLMMIVIPILSISLAYETINYGLENKWIIPYQLLGRPSLPDLFYKVRILRMIFIPIASINNLYAYAMASVAYMIVIGGIVSVAYAVAYRIVGPSRYSPLDAPPPNIKTKRYTR